MMRHQGLRQWPGIRKGGKSGPQVHGLLWRAEQLCPHLLQLVAGGLGGVRQTLAQARRVAAEVAVGQDHVQRALAVFGTAHVDQHLDVGQVTGQITMASNEAHAQRGGHRLGKAADVERAAQLVQRGDTRRGSRLEVGEGIVLHDQGIVAIGQLQDLVRLVRRGVRGRGIVRQRLGEEQRRLAGQLQFAFQGLDIRPVRMAREASKGALAPKRHAVNSITL